MSNIAALALKCNNCGANLSVPPDTRYLTCSYCHSQLQVHASGGAAYTEVLDRIDARTEHIAADVETIKLQNELEQLDREWAAAHPDGAAPGKNSGGAIGIILGCIFGLFALLIGAFWLSGAPSEMKVFGIFPVLIGFGLPVAAIMQGLKGTQDQEQYAARRAAILERLNQK